MKCTNRLRVAESRGSFSFRHVGDLQRMRAGIAEAIPSVLAAARGTMDRWRASVTRWRDGEKNGRVEERLGEVLWALDEARRGLAAQQARKAEHERVAEVARQEAAVLQREREREAEEERRHQAEVARAAAHRKALEEHLLRTATAWQQASTVRAFVEAVATALPEGKRGGHVTAWLEWATSFCRELDPLTHPEKVARAVAPG